MIVCQGERSTVVPQHCVQHLSDRQRTRVQAAIRDRHNAKHAIGGVGHHDHDLLPPLAGEYRGDQLSDRGWGVQDTVDRRSRCPGRQLEGGEQAGRLWRADAR